ncbi:MAG: polyamine aminopropyltransferase [Tepidanaerobacteraceae bacterium]
MELWFTENHSKNVKFSIRVKDVLFKTKSPYQHIAVYETEDFGRVLALDDVVQVTTKDEFIYHEMITHIPLFTHDKPKRVLIIGGGDGGSVREVLKHPINEVHHVEIDEQVLKTSKKFFPTISCGYDDSRTKIFFEDGIQFVKNNKGYDVIIIDSTDPLGPAVGLFSKDFYEDVFEALNDDGIMVAQTESPFYYSNLIKQIYDDISGLFKFANIYTAVVPTYPGVYWSFTMGSKKINPLSKDLKDVTEIDTKYYSKEIHKSCFVLPPFVKEMISTSSKK